MNQKRNPYVVIVLALSLIFCVLVWPEENDLVWSTLLGGSNNDWGECIAVDSAGNVTSRVETGLSPNKQYARHVHAYNSVGDGNLCNSHSAYTAGGVPTECFCFGGCDMGLSPTYWYLLDNDGYVLDDGDCVHVIGAGLLDSIPNPPNPDGSPGGDDYLIDTGEIYYGGFIITIPTWSPGEGSPQAGEKIYCRIFDDTCDVIGPLDFYGDSDLYTVQNVPGETFFAKFPNDPYYGYTDTQLPVELVSFDAIGRDGEVLLEWKTTTETGNLGFHIERSRDKVTFERISQERIPGAGFSTIENTYTYLDKDLTNGTTYYYNLITVDMNGIEMVANEHPAEATPQAYLPKDFALHQNYPNPFNPETWISYQLTERGQVTLKIYNVYGQLVKTLIEEEKAPGIYRVCWSGRDLHGSPVSSGVYFCRLKAGAFKKVIKMVLVR